MHPFSVLTLGIFVAGYITARWDLVTRIYELAIFAWDYGVVVRDIPSPLSFLCPESAEMPGSDTMYIHRHEPLKDLELSHWHFSSFLYPSNVSRPGKQTW